MAMRELTPQEIAGGQRGITEQTFNATQIQAMVRNMDGSKYKWRALKHDLPKFEAKLIAENEKLYYNLPSVFDKHMRDQLDSTFFNMLELRRKVETGKLTQKEADDLVGQAMFQRFVPPSVGGGTPDGTTPFTYEEFYRQSRS